MSTPKLDIFINEVKSFEYEITIYDRHEDDSKYLDSNFEPIPLLRLPKYIKTDYERFLTKLQDEALTEILLLDNHKIEKVLYVLNKIEQEFNEHWQSWHIKILKPLNKAEEDFDRDNDYFEIITLLYSEFGILEFNTNAYGSNGFNGTFGRITKELERDLYDALIIKDGLLHQLIHFTKEYLSSIQPAPAEPKVLAVEEQKSAPAVQKETTFKMLFKNEEDAEKIIKLIQEDFLSDVGDWIVEPKGRYLVALYLVLIEKGYLKSTYDAPQIARAFNKKFSTTLVSKSFQPAKSREAENYKEHFKVIPSLKNT